MSSYFADPPPSHAADPKVKENPKKENQKRKTHPEGGGCPARGGGGRRRRIGEGGRFGDHVEGGGAGSSGYGGGSADRVCAKTFQNTMPQFMYMSMKCMSILCHNSMVF